MRLDFKTLWVEDQPNAVADQSAEIAERMAEDGFDFKPIMCRSLDEAKSKVSDDVFNDEVDLVLVDWNLGGGVQGQQAIATVRDEGILYKDVVFYSAANNVQELRRLAFEAGVEGVYCATRAQLVMEVIGVFESLVKKVLDLDHSRGIVMGATSDIDRLVLETVDLVHGKIGDAEKQALVTEALGMIDERMSDHAKAFAKLREEGSMAALLKAHMLFTANDRLRMLSRILEQEAYKEHSAARASVVKYMTDVVPKRNDFGHKVLLPDGRTSAIASVQGAKEMSLEDVRDLRKLILNLRAEFRVLREAFSK